MTSPPQYCFYMLCKHLYVLKIVREEHDRVFGADLERTRVLIQENPPRINEFHWIQAVIWETFLLFSMDAVLHAPPKG
ncbi:hypothetical protein BDV10DRAFT_188177 [Aspergillus recurvatus]